MSTHQLRTPGKKIIKCMASAAIISIVSSQALARAQSTTDTQQVQLAKQPLGDALIALSRQFGVTILADERLVKGKTAVALSSEQSLESALKAVLTGTGLTVEQSEPGTFVIGQAEKNLVNSGQEPAGQYLEAVPNGVERIVVVGSSREYLYREESTNIFGFDATLAELPASVSIISADFLEDNLAYTIEDVVNYVPGVVNGGFTGGTNEALIIRGFQNNARFVNGLRQFDLMQQPFFVELVDRIEIAKGPAGSEFAVADAGGSFNYETKKPLAEFQSEFFGGAGTEGLLRIGGDITGPLSADGSVRYRLIALYNEGAEWRNGRPDETPRWTIAPSIAWDYASDGSVLFEYQRAFDDNPLDRGIWRIEGAGFRDNFAPRKFSIGQESNFQKTDTDRYDLTLTQALGSIFSVELRAQHMVENNEDFGLQFASIRPFLDDGLTWDGETTQASVFFRDRLSDISTDNYQVEFKAQFDTGRWSHNMRVGYQDYEAAFLIDYGQDGGEGRRTTSQTIDIFNPNNNMDFIFDGRDTAASFQVRQNISSIFAQWSGKYDDRLRILAGLRRDEAEFFERFDPIGSIGNPGISESEEVSFRLAASYDVTENTAIFGGYSDSYTPQSGLTRDGSQIEPLHNVSFELGAKTELFNGGVLWTNTLYQTTQDSISAEDPEDETGMFSIPFGEVRIRGFESEFIGSANENLDISAGVTFQDSENTRTEDPTLQGNAFFSVPDVQITSFANYNFSQLGLSNFSARLGVIYVGEREGNAINNYQLPSYVRVDLGARYILNDTITLDFFVENLFDEIYIESSQGRQFPESGIIPGAPRLLQFNIRYVL